MQSPVNLTNRGRHSIAGPDDERGAEREEYEVDERWGECDEQGQVFEMRLQVADASYIGDLWSYLRWVTCGTSHLTKLYRPSISLSLQRFLIHHRHSCMQTDRFPAYPFLSQCTGSHLDSPSPHRGS